MNAPPLHLAPPPRPELRVSDLSKDQRVAYDAVVRWVKDRPPGKPVLSMCGVAGSGKSSLLGLLAREPGLGPIAFATPTGKAASVLRRKLESSGIRTRGRLRRDRWGRLFDDQDDRASYVGTIHSLAYVPVEEKETGRVTGFGKQNSLDETYRFLCLDEASMISQETLEHLKGYGLPILLVGDHAQLPPVRSSGSVILRPDLKLEKIHRQAEGNPILALSARIRETGEIDERLADGARVRILPNTALRDELDRYEGRAIDDGLLDHAMIVFTNRRRKSLNAAVRDRLGFGTSGPTLGDVVLCLKNLHRMPIYNGMRGILSHVEPSTEPALLRSELAFPEDDLSGFRLNLSAVQFGREKTFEEFTEVETALIHAGLRQESDDPIESWGEVGSLFDYGYVVTGHKMQGSQAEEVCVVAERPGPVSDSDWRAWCYTTVTRAVERLTVLV